MNEGLGTTEASAEADKQATLVELVKTMGVEIEGLKRQLEVVAGQRNNLAIQLLDADMRFNMGKKA